MDINNPSELKWLISTLQKRRKKILRKMGYDEVSFAGSKYTMQHLYPAFESILQTDIGHLYKSSSQETIYYVYAHCHPDKILNLTNIKHIFLASRFGLTHEPIYIGKGTGDRYLQLDRNDSHRKIRSVLKEHNKDLLPVMITPPTLTENEALSLESKLIDILGLKSLSPHGILVNLDEGLMPLQRRKVYPNTRIVRKILNKNGFRV